MEQLVTKLLTENSPIAVLTLICLFGVRQLFSMNKQLQEARITIAQLETKIEALTKALDNLRDLIVDTSGRS